MVPESKTFLAATVLNDGGIVSYRTLSRELKVHCNVAKKMLYEFHSVQNSKKPGSVRANYILDGVPQASNESGNNGHQPDGEDVHMQSSPYMSSSMPQQESEDDSTPSRKIILARDEDLEAAKATFEKLHCIHIYSIGPSSVQNLQSLSECNRAMTAKHINEDPLVVGRQYGVIQNTGVRRRTGKRPTAPAVVSSSAKVGTKSQETKAKPQVPKMTDQPSTAGKPSRATPQAESKPAERRQSSKTAPLKREQSDIFKSFTKPKATLDREHTGSSAGQSPAPTIALSQDKNSVQADEPMRDASESEDEGDFIGTNKPKPELEKTRSEREAQLRRMMDDEDEDIGDATDEPVEVSQESEAVDEVNSEKASSAEPPAIVTGGRRRGRRKVMKKKTIKDEEGYLVTKEEPAWESFSEDEPVPQKDRTPMSTASSSTAKAKKPGVKPGQGNIMSFFGKK